MTQTMSFTPLAERLAAFADEIRSESEGRGIMEQIVGLFVCVVLHGLIGICHALDARARADAEAGMPRDVRLKFRQGGECSADRTGAPRYRLRLVSTAGGDTSAAPLPLDGEDSASSFPWPECGAKTWATRWPRLRQRPASTAGPPRNEGFAP